jgi:hypothetical protein
LTIQEINYTATNVKSIYKIDKAISENNPGRDLGPFRKCYLGTFLVLGKRVGVFDLQNRILMQCVLFPTNSIFKTK